MGRKPPSKKPEQAELDAFTERYETLSAIYADPVETLFEIMTHPDAGLDLRAKCAVDLMSFRFPKLKALEVKSQDNGKPVQFTINLVQNQPAKTEIDVSPPQLKLVGDK